MGQYIDRYADYLDKLQEAIRHGNRTDRRPLLGFCSNAEVVSSWDAESYNRILTKHLRTRPDQGRNEQIASMEDFARISSWYLMQGIGGNMDIANPQVCDALLEHFRTEPALGGTGAQAAGALGAIGIPSDVRLTDRSQPVCAMLGGNGIMMIENGTRIPVETCRDDSPPVYHFILQFRKDDVIEVGGKEIRIPCSNRLILF
jgi:ADP-dependent phosphofructokinase/glucokinase